MVTRSIGCLAVLTLSALLARSAWAESGEQTIVASTEVLQDLMNLPVQGIPASLLAEARGVAIIPNTIKVGLVLGGQMGKGVLVIREKDGNWRAPTFITIKGGSIGFQIGAQGSDVVLVFKTQKSVDGLMKGTFKIGADASAAAGPVGRSVEAATDAQLKAEIYSYSRSRGLFAGLSVDGSVIQIDNQATSAYYAAAAQGQPVPPAAQKLVELIAQVAARQEPAAGQTISPPELAPVAVPAQAVADTGNVKQQLSRSAAQLYGRLDPAWRQFLALPAETYGETNQPALADLKNSQARFDSVATDPRYSALTQLPEFQTTRNLLQAYITALTALGQPAVNLPPPPVSSRR